MQTDSNITRIVIAVSEGSPVPRMWRTALRYFGDSAVELRALFVADDRWQKVASLPVSCEVSRIGGAVADFTTQRADEIRDDAIVATRRHMEKLAVEASRTLAFEVLQPSDQHRMRELVGSAGSMLIASSLVTQHPICAQLEEFGCRVVIVEETEESGTGPLQHVLGDERTT